jgi:mRNA-degrading endonuclease RelE of RelBE toxin-antitoxin system
MNFEQTPEFSKELKQLKKKYRSLNEDLLAFEKIVRQFPEGQGKNFNVLTRQNDTIVVKGRLFCKALRDSSLRVVYAYHENSITFLFIEVFQKSEKEREDGKRIENYLKIWKPGLKEATEE